MRRLGDGRALVADSGLWGVGQAVVGCCSRVREVQGGSVTRRGLIDEMGGARRVLAPFSMPMLFAGGFLFKTVVDADGSGTLQVGVADFPYVLSKGRAGGPWDRGDVVFYTM